MAGNITVEVKNVRESDKMEALLNICGTSSPLLFKKVKKTLNHWYTLCKVFGKRLDECKEDLLRARDEGRLQPVAMRCSRYTQQTET